MSSEEIFEKVKSIIVEQLGVTETSVTMEASFIDDLGADSLDIVELIMALDELEKERGIKKDYVIESIETALVTAYKRNFDVTSDNVKITLNRETGETHVYEELNVVNEVEDWDTQISVEDAKKIDPRYNEGDVVEKELMPKNFGRIAAGTAKQVIIQKIREASREVIFSEFNEKKGEIVSGIVQKVDKNIVVLDLGKIEGIMPIKEQIPTEHYYVNQKLRACVANVEKGAKGSTQIIVSRANNDFLRKLFELEIPEISDGSVLVYSVAREAGFRSKVAVYSEKANIDPIGACIGEKGSRIANILEELHGEKVDIVKYDKDPQVFIENALAPAKDLKVLIMDPKKQEALVVADGDNFSLAIGKKGMNARLASRLTKYKIDIIAINVYGKTKMASST